MSALRFSTFNSPRVLLQHNRQGHPFEILQLLSILLESYCNTVGHCREGAQRTPFNSPRVLLQPMFSSPELFEPVPFNSPRVLLQLKRVYKRSPGHHLSILLESYCNPGHFVDNGGNSTLFQFSSSLIATARADCAEEDERLFQFSSSLIATMKVTKVERFRRTSLSILLESYCNSHFNGGLCQLQSAFNSPRVLLQPS